MCIQFIHETLGKAAYKTMNQEEIIELEVRLGISYIEIKHLFESKYAQNKAQAYNDNFK